MDALERLLAEFFAPSTSTDRKRSIELQLETQRPSLDDCRFLLSNGPSDLLAWYAASQFQKRIHTEWSGLDPGVQQSNRSFLLHFLSQHFGTVAPEQGRWASLGPMEGNGSGTLDGSKSPESSKTFPPFVLNKVIQLVTDIALLDWPDRFPELLPEILTLIQSKNRNHGLLGWTILEAFVQEFIATYPAPGSGASHRPRFVLSQRQQYLWGHFKGQVPELMTLMVQHLDTSYNRTLVAPLATEAPAPSPVENGIWGGTTNFGRRPSAAAQPLSPLMPNNSSFYGSRAVPGSISNSFANFNASGSGSFISQSQDQGAAYSFGKSPTTALRKSLSQFLGGSGLGMDDDHAMPPPSPAQGSGLHMLHARQRMGSISELGQMAMRRNSINAAAMQSRRGSVDATFVSGSRMDSHTRKTCLLALKALTALLSCPALDAKQASFSSAIAIVLKFSTLHQNKTVDLGILALSCLNGLVARPGFLATNQEAMAGAIKIMSSLIRYFNEVKDGIDDIDEGYLQMFMHFVAIFCTLPHLERAEREQGLPTADFLHSFAKFTLEKVSVDYLKACMDIWKGLLDAMIYSASELPRPIPAEHPLRRLQAPLLFFLSALVNNFYDMKGATQSEEAFSTFEVEDEEDLGVLTELVESFAGLMGEIFMDEVIEMLNPLLHQQLDTYSRRDIGECKTLPVTLGILTRIAYNFQQNFDRTRQYTSNLFVSLTRTTRISIEYYGATGGASSPGKDEAELTGSITLALLHSLMPLIPWLEQLRQAETNSNVHTSPGPIAQDIYRELVQILCNLFKSLLPSSSAVPLLQQASGNNSAVAPALSMSTFLGPVSTSCSPMDRKLLHASVTSLRLLTLQVRMPTMSGGDKVAFWNMEPIQGLVSCLHQNVLLNGDFMGDEFPTSMLNSGLEEEESLDREGITPTDELFQLAFTAVTYGLVLGVDDNTHAPVSIPALVRFLAPITQPFRDLLEDPRAAQSAYWSNPDVRSTIHRSLAIIRAVVASVSEASDTPRGMVFEASKVMIHYAEQYLKIYLDDQEIYMDILRFYKVEIKSLNRLTSATRGLLIAQFLMDQLTSPNPSLLDTAFTTSPLDQQRQQRSFAEHQQMILDRIKASVEIIRTVLEISKKEVTAALPDFARFLFFQLGPKLMGTGAKIGSPSTPLSLSSSPAPQERSNGDSNNGVLELMGLYLSTIKTMVLNHSRYFFSHTLNSKSGGSIAGCGATTASAAMDPCSQEALQGCLETLAQGLHRPEPDVVRQSIEILREMHQSHLCRLFDREEFQTRFRFEFLQILFRLALSHGQDLLLEEMADLMHLMVKDSSGSISLASRRLSGLNQRDHSNGLAGSQEAPVAGSFLSVWHGDLKRIVAELQVTQVLSATDLTSAHGGGSSPGSFSNGGGSTDGSDMYAGLLFPDSVKEQLWMGLQRLAEESGCREGLYDFVSDARVYAQGVLQLR